MVDKIHDFSKYNGMEAMSFKAFKELVEIIKKCSPECIVMPVETESIGQRKTITYNNQIKDLDSMTN